MLPLRLLAAPLLAAVLAAPLAAQPADPKGTLSVIAFGSCAEQRRPQPIWDTILAQRPQLFLFLGDNIYADAGGVATMAAEYDRLDRIPGFRRLRAAVPHWATWDDHDYGTNDGGRDFPGKAESQRLFLKFWKEPADSPRRRREGLYDAKVFGPEGRRVQVILLDTRTFRSPLKPRPEGEVDGVGRWLPREDEGADMLGAAQWTWLEAQLRVPAELRLLVSSVQFLADNHGWEKWGNLPAERRRLLDLLKRTGARGVVVLSGDRHFSELAVADVGLGYPFFEFTSSGLNQGAERWRYRTADPTRLSAQTWGHSFGVIRIHWDRPDPLVRLECRDEAGDLRFQEKIPLSLLGVQPAPAGTPRGRRRRGAGQASPR
jgi:alkaline phosphatase D